MAENPELKTCRHENRIGPIEGSCLCKDCGAVFQLTDPVIAAIVDSAYDYTTQLRIAAVLGSAR